MKKFIEVTEIGGAKVMLNTEKIISVLQCIEGTFIETDTDKKGEATGIMVSDPFEKIANKIQNCEV